MNNETESKPSGYLDDAVMDAIRLTMTRTNLLVERESFERFFYELGRLSVYGFFTDMSVTAIQNLIYGSEISQEVYLDFLQEFLYTLVSRGVTLDTISYIASNTIISNSDNVKEYLGQHVSVDEVKSKDILLQCLYLIRVNLVFAVNTFKNINIDIDKSKEKDKSWQRQNIKAY